MLRIMKLVMMSCVVAKRRKQLFKAAVENRMRPSLVVNVWLKLIVRGRYVAVMRRDKTVQVQLNMYM